MDLIKVTAVSRNQTGKGPARRLRAGGLIPATAYGKALSARSLSLAPKQIHQVLATEHGRNSVIELSVEDQESVTVLLIDFQYNPLTRELLHADFKQIRLDEPLQVDVPFELTGRPKGVVTGGVLRQVFRYLPVRCLPEQIPARLEHDVSELDVDEHVSISDLALPPGVEICLPTAQTVASVVSMKEVAGAEDGAAEGAAVEGAEAVAGDKPAEAASKPES